MTQRTGKIRRLKRIFGEELLLMEAEYRCFKIGQRFYRRQLVSELADIEKRCWPFWVAAAEISRPAGERFSLAVAALALLPLSLLGQLLVSSFKLFKLPFQLLNSCILPADLQAPGEKSLTGLHNAFSSKLSLNHRYFILCLDSWLYILFPDKVKPELTMQHCLNKVGLQIQEAINMGLDDPEFRLLGSCRERLSQHYGHYASRH